MTTKLLTLAILAGTGMLLGSSPVALAAMETYDFTFTSSGMNATGTISIDNGVTQVGSIYVTGVPVEASPSTLISVAGSLIPPSLSGVNRDPSGDQIPNDNLVNSSAPFITQYGLGFGSGQYAPGYYDTLIGLNAGNAYNQLTSDPSEYTLFVGEALLDANGNVVVDQYVYNWDSGSLTLTAVPEPATYGAFASAGLLLVSLGRQLRRQQA